ncbi:MAG: Maf family protein [Mucispirillum sp.]|nr:Maf family protein [Mucispirillum sp.]
MKNYKFILASASPRRKELLSVYIKDFKVMPADIDETVPNNIILEDIPLYIAKEKAAAVFDKLGKEDIIITADTIVLLDSKIYGKPKNKLDAYNMIKTLSGKTHQVITGVCCYSKDKQINIEFSDTTNVSFIEISDEIIEKYLENAEYIDKAGAYAVQGIASMFVEKIEGSYDNVVGLPMGRLARNLIKYRINLF